MASQSKQPPTNERIVRMLEEVRAQLADAGRRQDRIERDLARLLKQR